MKTLRRVIFFRRDVFLLSGIVLFALTLRLLHVSQIASTPLFHGLAVDSPFYRDLATKILEGQVFHDGFNYLSPFYPFFLALIYGVFGIHQLPIAIVQSILDCFSCILIYYIGQQLFSKSVGLIAAFIYAGYGIAIFYAGLALAPTTVIFFILGSISSLLFALERNRVFFVLSGLSFGLVSLARSNIVLFLPVLAFWFLTCGRKKLGIRYAASALGLFAVGFSLLMGLSTARNYLSAGRFTPFSAQGGLNFYIGTHEKAEGGFMSVEGIPWKPVEQVKASIKIAEKELEKSVTPDEASTFWFTRGLDYIRTQPADALRLYLRKTAMFWRSEEIPLNVSYPLNKEFSSVMRWPLFGFGIIAPFSLMGLALAVRDGGERLLLVLFVLLYMISVVLFFISDRYRLPVVPCLIIFASYSLISIRQWTRTRNRRALFPALGIGLVLFLAVNMPSDHFALAETTRGLHHYNVGVRYMAMGDLDKAVSRFKKVLRMSPGFAPAHYKMGQVLLLQGEPGNAERHLLESTRIRPDYTAAYYELGRLWGKEGDSPRAIAYFKEVLKGRPKNADIHFLLGNFLAARGNLQKAVAHYSEAIFNRPRFAEALNGKGLVLARQGATDRAVESFLKAIQIRPNWAEAHRNLGAAYWFAGDEDAARQQVKTLRGLDRNLAKHLEQLVNGKRNG